MYVSLQGMPPITKLAIPDNAVVSMTEFQNIERIPALIRPEPRRQLPPLPPRRVDQYEDEDLEDGMDNLSDSEIEAEFTEPGRSLSFRQTRYVSSKFLFNSEVYRIH